MYRAIHFLHLVAAATWLGGMITLAAVVGALRKAGVERPVIVAAARAFARISWPALILAIASGLAQVHMLALPWSYRPLAIKIGLVVVTSLVALGHVRFAKRLAPAARGALEGVLLLLTLSIFLAAVSI
jgi:putative copper export protein